jgi:hypothetical protein
MCSRIETFGLENSTRGGDQRSQWSGRRYGADDGIRTRDPHLGNVKGTVRTARSAR